MQRTVEAVIGRLVTDEGFRRRFRERPAAVLDELMAGGAVLTSVERRALAAIDLAACEQLADRVDPRLQKISLRGDARPCASGRAPDAPPVVVAEDAPVPGAPGGHK